MWTLIKCVVVGPVYLILGLLLLLVAFRFFGDTFFAGNRVSDLAAAALMPGDHKQA
ncbi:hypothetical protein [Oceanobacter sp. 4_MG-2023]|uniref:hypothetical protein n=1 Tax=Oceanobacter sp. 4_MG-2023 TaxID=3062623 RepID=UPI002732FB8D|nr:hypothetical protein [Oceanobacter sp. 4_MG-2023]MDP2547352.1 hypothetical protein [Oceanobacter sp. 4_MG-2023]